MRVQSTDENRRYKQIHNLYCTYIYHTCVPRFQQLFIFNIIEYKYILIIRLIDSINNNTINVYTDSRRNFNI